VTIPKASPRGGLVGAYLFADKDCVELEASFKAMLHFAPSFNNEQPVGSPLRRLLLQQEQMLDAWVLRTGYHKKVKKVKKVKK
jgi:hypothetical protein